MAYMEMNRTQMKTKKNIFLLNTDETEMHMISTTFFISCSQFKRHAHVDVLYTLNLHVESQRNII